MEDYSFTGKYILKDPRKKNSHVTIFRGEFFRESNGELIGEFFLGDDPEVYDLTGKLNHQENIFLLNALAKKRNPSNIRELPLELQFSIHGRDILGSYGGGIRLALQEIIDRIEEGKDPLPKEPYIWIYHRSEKNSTLRLNRGN
jgi:hypothetical protein